MLGGGRSIRHRHMGRSRRPSWSLPPFFSNVFLVGGEKNDLAGSGEATDREERTNSSSDSWSRLEHGMN